MKNEVKTETARAAIRLANEVRLYGASEAEVLAGYAGISFRSELDEAVAGLKASAADWRAQGNDEIAQRQEHTAWLIRREFNAYRLGR